MPGSVEPAVVVMSEFTHLLDAAASGDRQAAAELLPLVYDELRQLAAAQMAAEKPGHTLSATALVHEAYLRLVGDQHFDGQGHFFAAAAEAMRRILVKPRAGPRAAQASRRASAARLPQCVGHLYSHGGVAVEDCRSCWCRPGTARLGCTRPSAQVLVVTAAFPVMVLELSTVSVRRRWQCRRRTRWRRCRTGCCR